jgi:hypothetical protein
MALTALNIIKEEIARAKENTPYVRHALLEALEVTITQRIENECLDQPEPEDSNIDRAVNYLRGVHVMDDVDVMDDGEFSVEVEVCDEAQMRDHMRRGGDPADLFNDAIKKLVRCTWCKKEDSEAVAEFWVQEPGEFRNSKEALCEGCADSLIEDGIRVEAVIKGPQEHCRFCGSTRDDCHGGGFTDGIEAHDFTAHDVISNMDEEDVPF